MSRPGVKSIDWTDYLPSTPLEDVTDRDLYDFATRDPTFSAVSATEELGLRPPYDVFLRVPHADWDRFQEVFFEMRKQKYAREKEQTKFEPEQTCKSCGSKFTSNKVRVFCSRSCAKTKHALRVNGKSLTLKEAAEQAGVSYQTILQRHRRGASGKELIAPKKDLNRYLVVKGVRKTLRSWAAERGLQVSTINERLQRGDSDERALRVASRTNTKTRAA